MLRTFGIFQDWPESPFYESAGRTPEETWDEVSRSMTDVLKGLAAGDPPSAPTTEDVVRHHGDIFRTTFPEDAGRVRAELHKGEREDIVFGITIGTAAMPVDQQCRGTRPRNIVPRLDAATKEFSDAMVALEAGSSTPVVADVALPLAKLYAKILSIHPFVDGNLRSAFVVLQQAMLSTGLGRMIHFDPRAHDSAIGAALRVGGKQSYEPLASLILKELLPPQGSGRVV